ncbi:uroporphyrinogen-III C-methyltransferase [Thalassotalea euphylliae]|uniref:Heme biosynthesis operon protein HemX n=1 Tax=Thalassotalea euphylliae TaxID=1655234 RepID=A0A3E0U3K8_9GAMM|nr:uroporphyrinogen-III C-methyltransferase [Thalassotalea euphylliae]REL31359.1 hypothetical protein DXX94_11895 [Thalassotalea euphylliae]
MTTNTTPESADNNAKSSKVETSASATKVATKKAPTPTQSQSSAPQAHNAISKVGLLALVLSVGAFATIGGGYLWLQEQQKLLLSELSQHQQQQNNSVEQSLKQALASQQQSTLAQIPQLAEQAVAPAISPVQQELAQLKALTLSLQQTKNTPWQLKEAEYLIRVASRSLWLEQDAQLATRLLNEADDKLKATKNPEFLPVRKLISQDIAALNLLPELATDDVILTLMGLAEQVNRLPIAMAHLPTPTEAEPDLELSDDIADYKENLAKTWQKIANYFFTVKRRASNVEALLSPEQQNILRQNLILKLQLAQWAVSQHKKALYQESLVKVNAWLSEYFDTDSPEVTGFIDTVTSMNNQVISLSLPSKLESYTAISRLVQSSAQGNVPSDAQDDVQNDTSPADNDENEKRKADNEQDSAGAIL